MFSDMPKPVAGSDSTFDLYSLCYQKTHTPSIVLPNTFSAYSSRVKNLEGALAEENNMLYVWCKFTVNAASVGSSTNYARFCSTDLASDYLPRLINREAPLFTKSGTSNRQFFIAYESSSTMLAIRYGQIMTQNEEYEIYGLLELNHTT